MNDNGKLRIRDGWVLCPCCGRGKVLHLIHGTRAENLEVYCRRCCRSSVLNIASESLSQR